MSKKSSKKKTSQTKKSKEVKVETPEVKVETPEVKVSLDDLIVREAKVETTEETIPIFERRGLNLGRRQKEAYLENRGVIESEYSKRSETIKKSLCVIGEKDLIKKTLDLCLLSILSDYVETGTPQVIYSLSDFGNNIDKDLETFESIPVETVRDYVKVSEQRTGFSFSQVLSDLETLREIRSREKPLRTFLKGLILHFSGGDHKASPKKNIDISPSVSGLWSEIKDLIS